MQCTWWKGPDSGPCAMCSCSPESRATTRLHVPGHTLGRSTPSSPHRVGWRAHRTTPFGTLPRTQTAGAWPTDSMATVPCVCPSVVLRTTPATLLRPSCTWTYVHELCKHGTCDPLRSMQCAPRLVLYGVNISFHAFAASLDAPPAAGVFLLMLTAPGMIGQSTAAG